MRARLLALIPAVAAASALGCAPSKIPVAAPQPLASSPGHNAGSPGHARLPDVPLLDLARAPKSVEAVRAGRAALVTFWATWCDACQKEMPALNRLDERATGDHAVVIGVAVGEPAAKVRAYVDKHGLRYTQLVDEDFRLTDALGQKRLPATVVLSRRGEVVFVGGALDAEALAALRAALKEE